MDRDRLVLIRPDPRRHAEEVFDLTGKVFGQNGHNYWDWLAACRGGYFHGSGYDWAASTIGLLDGRIVTHWGVWGYRMRVGRAAVATAGVGAVATDGTLRRRGLMARTIAGALPAMHRAGYDMTVLFGRPDFYHRFGYVRAWPGRAYIVAAGALPNEPAPPLRRFAAPGGAEFARLYNRRSAGLTGTAIRPTYVRNRHKDLRGLCWRDAGGRLAGFVLLRPSPGKMELFDSAGDAECILRVLGRVARREKLREISLPNLHHDSDLARLLRRGDCRLELSYHRSGGPMVRTLDLRRTLERLSGELTRRLRASPASGWRGTLLIADADERACLHVGSGGVRVGPGSPSRHAVRGGSAVAQLLIGTDEPGETCQAGRIRLSGDARPLVETLFPNRHPVLAAWDCF